jgi:predicted MFS family arabinose efflux permease
MFINVPIGIAVVALTPLFVTETPRRPGRFDLPGAVTSTAGVAAIVYGFIRAASNGWGDTLTVGAFVGGVVLLAVFVLNEARAQQPITPLRLFADRTRSGSFGVRLLLVAGMMGMFFFLTQFLQEVLGLSAVMTGVAFLPMTLLLFAVSRLMPRLLPRFGGYRLMLAGIVPVVIGMAWLSRVSAETGYWSGVFGPMVLFGAGMGVVFVPLTTASLTGVRQEDSGAASSMVNVMQQLGGSVGLAVLVAVFGTATRSAAAHPAAGLSAAAQHLHALAHGMSTAFALAAVFDVAALVAIALLLRPHRPAVPDDAAEIAAGEALSAAMLDD